MNEIEKAKMNDYIPFLKGILDEDYNRPAASPEPIIPHWIKDGTRAKATRYICSYCREYAYNVPNKTTMQYKYCPNCGSPMLLERSVSNAETQDS